MTPVDNDPLERARELKRLHTAVLSGNGATAQLRPVVWQSWRRSLGAHVDPDRHEPASSLPSGDLRQHRDAHPFATMLPMLRETLLGEADEASQVMILTDANGHILWREGKAQVQRDAEAVRLTEGTSWAEESIGTNAMGTALAAETPVQIHSAEHLVRTYHSWTCAASPVHCPDTGRLIGALDISGPLHTMHPALLSLVTTSARLVESQLRLLTNQQDEAVRTRNEHHLTRLGGQPGALLSSSGRVLSCEPRQWLTPGRRIPLGGAEGAVLLDDGTEAELEPLPEGYLLRARQRTPDPAPRPLLALSLLGDGVPTATVDGHRQELTLRHAEILALLAMHPRGLTAEQLTLLLHGEQGNPTTVRAEIHRLRNCVHPQVLRTRPYRITADVTSDFGTLREELHSGDVNAALDEHHGLLLPRSESPGIRREREELLVAVREALLNHGTTEHLWNYCGTGHGQDDLEILERLRTLLPGGSSRRGTVETRIHRLLEDES